MCAALLYTKPMTWPPLMSWLLPFLCSEVRTNSPWIEKMALFLCVFMYLKLSENLSGTIWFFFLYMNSRKWGMNEQVTSAWAAVSLATNTELCWVFAADWTGGRIDGKKSRRGRDWMRVWEPGSKEKIKRSVRRKRSSWKSGAAVWNVL